MNIVPPRSAGTGRYWIPKSATTPYSTTVPNVSLNSPNNSNSVQQDVAHDKDNDKQDDEHWEKIPKTTPAQLFSVNVITCLVLWYSFSSLTTQLTKHILNDFDFPVFVGEFQFLFNFILGYITIYSCRVSDTKKFFPKATFPQNNSFKINKTMFRIFFPMGTFQFVGKLFSLAATSLCSVATVSSIRALSPLFIVLGYRIYYKVLFPLRTYVSLIPLLLGVIIIVISQSDYSNNLKLSLYAQQLNESNLLNDTEISDSGDGTNAVSTLSSIFGFFSENPIQMDGIVYALISTTIFAAGSIYAKTIISNNFNPLYLYKEKKEIAKVAILSTESTTDLTNIDIEKNYDASFQDEFQQSSSNEKFDKTSSGKVDKLTTLMYCSLYGLLYSIPTFLTYELPSLLTPKLIPSNVNADSIIEIPNYCLIPWNLLIVNGFSYFAQSLLAFHILGMLPTVTYSISAMMKRIFVIGISILVNGKDIGILEWLGLLHVSAGLYIYEKWGSKDR